MWLILFAVGLGVVVTVISVTSFTLLTFILSLIYALVFLISIIKDSKSPKTSVGAAMAILISAFLLSDLIKANSSSIFGLIYVFALGLAVYSAWQLYLAAANKREVNQ